jgi:predicted phosphodiesterase
MKHIRTIELGEDVSSIKLYSVNDLHLGDSLCKLDDFRKFVKMVQEDPYAYVVCVGDLLNNNLKSSKGSCYEDVMNPQEQKKAVVEELRPIKDKILCMVSGNHEYRSNKDAGNDPTEDMAMILGVPYKRDESIIKVCLGKDSRGKRISYIIAMIHGSGGGKSNGAAINSSDNFIYTLEGVDILITGHTHKKVASRVMSRRIDNKNCCIVDVEKLCVVSPSWLSYGSYGVRGMFRPSPTGAGIVILSGTHKEFYTEI